MKRGKKGIAQIDWVISFVIFFLYLVWFFVYVRPVIEPTASTESQLYELKNNLLNDASWSITAAPIFVFSNLTLNEEPIIARYVFSWQDPNLGFEDERDFYLAEGKIFFIANLTNVSGNIFWIAHSTENYTKTNVSRGIIADADSVVIEDSLITFENSVLSRADYSGNNRMSNFNFSIDKNPVLSSDYETGEFYASPLLARYLTRTSDFNISFYAFPTQSKIHAFAYSRSLQKHNLTLVATFQNYTNYYATEQRKGAFNNTCVNFSSNFIDLYDASDGVSIYLEDFANGTICSEGGRHSLSLVFPLKNETGLSIMFHKGNYYNATKFLSAKKIQFGAPEEVTGLSLAKFSIINTTEYSGLKRNWSTQNDFSFLLINESGTTVASYTPVAMPNTKNIYASKSDINTLDKNGNKKRHSLLIRTW